MPVNNFDGSNDSIVLDDELEIKSLDKIFVGGYSEYIDLFRCLFAQADKNKFSKFVLWEAIQSIVEITGDDDLMFDLEARYSYIRKFPAMNDLE